MDYYKMEVDPLDDCEIKWPPLDDIVKRKQELFNEFKNTNKLFEDQKFDLSNHRLITIYSEDGVVKKEIDVEWKRPYEILNPKRKYWTKQPEFYLGHKSKCGHTVQVNGEIGNCWLHVALVQLMKYKNMFDKVTLPDLNSFTKEKSYCGAFHFRFWHFAKWVDIEIDDRLPVRKGTTELISMKSSNCKEFWSPLLEKAYVKFRINTDSIWRGYGDMDSGTVTKAYHNLTGGIAEQFYVKKEREISLLEIMKKSLDRNAFMACVIQEHAKKSDKKDFKARTGLNPGHAYEIVGVFADETSTVVKLKDPNEINASKDQAVFKRYVALSIAMHIAHWLYKKFNFWSKQHQNKELICPFELWKKNYDVLEVVSICPKKINANDNIQCDWKINVLNGEWKESGGSFLNNLREPDKFGQNPQIFFECTSESALSKCEVRIALLSDQMKFCKCELKKEKEQCVCRLIGYNLCWIDDPDKQTYPLSWEYFVKNFENFKFSVHYSQYSEVSNTFDLQPGTYCLIPSTFKAGSEIGKFTIRILTQKGTHITINKERSYPNTSIPQVDNLNTFVPTTLDDLDWKPKNGLFKELPELKRENMENEIKMNFNREAINNRLDEEKIVLILDAQFFKKFKFADDQINVSGLITEYRGMHYKSMQMDFELFRKTWRKCLTMLYTYYFEVDNIINSERFNAYLQYRISPKICSTKERPKVVDFFYSKFCDENPNYEEFIQIKYVAKARGGTDGYDIVTKKIQNLTEENPRRSRSFEIESKKEKK